MLLVCANVQKCKVKQVGFSPIYASRASLVTYFKVVPFYYQCTTLQKCNNTLIYNLISLLIFYSVMHLVCLSLFCESSMVLQFLAAISVDFMLVVEL